jgi:hypothetical protein
VQLPPLPFSAALFWPNRSARFFHFNATADELIHAARKDKPTNFNNGFFALTALLSLPLLSIFGRNRINAFLPRFDYALRLEIEKSFSAAWFPPAPSFLSRFHSHS